MLGANWDRYLDQDLHRIDPDAMDLIVVLDTDAHSDWRRSGRRHANIADRVVLPSIVLGELLHGFGKGGRAAENMAKLDGRVLMPLSPWAMRTTKTKRPADGCGPF